MKKASGKLGDTVVYRQLANGDMVIANTPKKTETVNETLLDIRSKFKDATQYARFQMQNADMKALYETGITAKKISAYTVAMTDYLKKPVVKTIDSLGYTGAPGQTLRIRATDDFRVKAVTVAIVDSTGAIVESGAATQSPILNELFEYVTTAAVAALAGAKIRAIASDHAGNSTTLEVTLQ